MNIGKCQALFCIGPAHKNDLRRNLRNHGFIVSLSIMTRFLSNKVKLI